METSSSTHVSSSGDRITANDKIILGASISKGSSTALYDVAGKKHTDFLEKLVTTVDEINDNPSTSAEDLRKAFFTCIKDGADIPCQTQPMASHQRPELRLPITAKYPRLCGPLYEAALEGDWKRANAIIGKDPTITGASIAKGRYTALHVAAGARHVDFVHKLVTRISEIRTPQDYLKSVLRLHDKNGNTALCLAAAAGSVEIAKIMIQRDPQLPKQLGSEGMTPLYFATLFGHPEMAAYLYSQPRAPEENLLGVFFTCIKTGLYGLAKVIVKENVHVNFALERDEDGRTALHLLAKRPLKDDNPAYELASALWDKVEEGEFRSLLTGPSYLLFDAVESGNTTFVNMLLEDCPDLIWETNDKNWSLIHAAVKHRNQSIFSKIYEIGLIKDVITTYRDNENDNTLLHLAAELAPAGRLSELPGAAFQMQRELLWFEKVKKVTPPSFLEKKNKYDKTAQELFTSEHEDLLKEGRKWMNGTARSCTIISTLIASVLFTSGTTVLVTGSPDLKNGTFQAFIISDTMAFFLALGAIFKFLAILTSTFAERDFLQDLPKKLFIGVILLLLSIAAMMVALSMALFIGYGRYYLPIFLTVCAGVPVYLYLVHTRPLFSLISNSKIGEAKTIRKRRSTREIYREINEATSQSSPPGP